MFKVPDLPYGYGDLAPHLDEETLMVHYGKHHQGYCKKLNAAVSGTDMAAMSLNEIIIKANDLPQGVKNTAGGVWNHSFYWRCMGVDNHEPSARMMEIIEKSFGSFENLQKEFNAVAGGIFGSGWAWLIKNADGGLEIATTANQDNPMNGNAEAHPVLTIDVWEHAYYLQYKNLRPDYIEAFWEVLDWNSIEEHYDDRFDHM